MEEWRVGDDAGAGYFDAGPLLERGLVCEMREGGGERGKEREGRDRDRAYKGTG